MIDHLVSGGSTPNACGEGKVKIPSSQSYDVDEEAVQYFGLALSDGALVPIHYVVQQYVPTLLDIGLFQNLL